MTDLTGRFKGCLLGLACGDAVGTTVEFQPPGSFPPVTDMVGGGPFHLKAGQWTDDTSMALCLAASLIECGEFNALDQMQRYCAWRAEGYMSSTGRCFDIGNTVSHALGEFIGSGNPYSGSTHEHSAGNGSIMRLAPVPMFYYPNINDAVYYSGESSRTTHGAQECVEACRLFASMIHKALDGKNKQQILFENDVDSYRRAKIQKIARGEYKNKGYKEIRGSGYVIDSLEAALWCFLNSDNFKDAILLAVNLGDDADTTAAVCGQIAGAFYGVEDFPDNWLNTLTMADTIAGMALSLLQKGGVNKG
jgi:ADP-ribosyl-[dinitrogen reductase] hydrolase